MINGILNIYKEKGYTSHDVVARLRGIVGQKKIGHTGTLDPDAKGVLPVCLGRATRVCDMLTDRDKVYEAVLLLGTVTDTQDVTGQVLETHPVTATADEVRKRIMDFEGEYDQIPPMYSALKVGGKKLYELAREGKTVERKSRKVYIRRIRVGKIELPRVQLEVECSKGTYIRTLCHDIGAALGCGGCMESLVRTRAGQFEIGESLRLEQVEQAVKKGRLDEILIPVDLLFSACRRMRLKPRSDSLGHNGNPLEMRDFSGSTAGGEEKLQPGDTVRIYDSRDNFIGIYRYDSRSGRFRPEKMFFDPETIR